MQWNNKQTKLKRSTFTDLILELMNSNYFVNTELIKFISSSSDLRSLRLSM